MTKQCSEGEKIVLATIRRPLPLRLLSDNIPSDMYSAGMWLVDFILEEKHISQWRIYERSRSRSAQ